jgi:FkbM family methyltransferase
MLGDTKQWFKDRGDETLRLDYDLNESSIVFDVGAYMGLFTDRIYEKYESIIYAFEPVEEYSSLLKIKYINQPHICVVPFALAGFSGYRTMFLNGDSSSIYTEIDGMMTIVCATMDEVLKAYDVEKIDLLKLNIESSEYDLLDDMLDKGLVDICSDIQVQFHTNIPDYKERYKSISDRLSATHELTWRYPFVWENWRRK